MARSGKIKDEAAMVAIAPRSRSGRASAYASVSVPDLVRRVTAMEDVIGRMTVPSRIGITRRDAVSYARAKRMIMSYHLSNPEKVVYPHDVAAALELPLMQTVQIHERLLADGFLVEDR